MCDLTSSFLHQLMVLPLKQHLSHYYTNLLNTSVLKLPTISSSVAFFFDILEGMKNLRSERQILLDFNFLQQLFYQI